MKQLIAFDPLFNPSAKTLDFSQYPNFQFDRLYGVINVSRNTILFAPGAAGYGASAVGTLVTVQVDTSTHSSTDEINVYYDTAAGWESNQAAENGGNIQNIAETMQLVLQELRVMNYILAEGLNIKRDDVVAMRNDVVNIQNEPNN